MMYPSATFSLRLRVFLLLLSCVTLIGCQRESVSSLRVGLPTMEERISACAARFEWWADASEGPTRFRLLNEEGSKVLVDTIIQGRMIELQGLLEPGRSYVYEVSQGEGAFEQKFRVKSAAEQYWGRIPVTVNYWVDTLGFSNQADSHLYVEETADGLLMSLDPIPGIPACEMIPMKLGGTLAYSYYYSGGDSLHHNNMSFYCETRRVDGYLFDNRQGYIQFWNIWER
jgi:hypothetical protein